MSKECTTRMLLLLYYRQDSARLWGGTYGHSYCVYSSRTLRRILPCCLLPCGYPLKLVRSTQQIAMLNCCTTLYSSIVIIVPCCSSTSSEGHVRHGWQFRPQGTAQKFVLTWTIILCLAISELHGLQALYIEDRLLTKGNLVKHNQKQCLVKTINSLCLKYHRDVIFVCLLNCECAMPLPQ